MLPSQGQANLSVSPDDVSELYQRKNVSLTVKVLREEHREGLPSILLEGSRASLEWLAVTILAQARHKRDCSFFFGPDGPGNSFFDKKKAEFGFGTLLLRKAGDIVGYFILSVLLFRSWHAHFSPA